MAKLPRAYEAFRRSYPQIWEVYDQLGGLSHRLGPLNEKTRELVKLAMAMGAKLEGAVHSHTHRAMVAGATPREVRHVVLLGLTTLGFPSMMAALSWVEDVLKKASPRKNRIRK